MKRKLIGIIHWWMQLEPIRHRHWCPNTNDCYHRSVAWYCEGLFCSDVDRKPCPNCVENKFRICRGTMGASAIKCTCGHGSE